MKRTRLFAATSIAAVSAIALAACGGSGGNTSSGGGNSNATFNQASTALVNPSSNKGGTITYQMSSDFDSMDPGNTYYGFSWNFTRLYATPLLEYDSVTPGQTLPKLVPALATGLGKPSDNFKTWTYTIKSGMKFSNGQPITSTDIKYAVARSNFAPTVLNKGPVYFQNYLINPNKYAGPYKDKNLNDFQGVTTPNATTVVFHLSQPFAEFDYLAAIPQTAPVPPSADTGANGGVNYQTHVVSSGPYEMQSYQPGKEAILVKNPNWVQSESPQAKQLADKIVFQANITQSTIDANLVNGSAEVDLAGTGMGDDATRSQVLTDSSKKAQTDDPLSGFEWYAALNTVEIPNVHCRQAIQYATNKKAVQDAYGGEIGGQIAGDFQPPWIAGAQNKTFYPSGSGNTGDLTAAKQQLQACGKPSGFSTSIAYRSDRPKEKNAALAIQAALARVGIKLTLYGYPSANIATVIGTPSVVHKNNLGIMMYGWQADFPTGFGFMFAVTDPAAITQAGNSNIEEETNPSVEALFKQVVSLPTAAQREAIYNQIDTKVMQDAVVMPLLYAKSLLYRPPNLTNVMVNYAYGMYDYTQLGLSGS